MSAIAGIVNLDGAPADERLLRRMASRMIGRAPDGVRVWCSGPVGLAHALLRIPGEPDESEQPYSVDGRTWIAADARIDGREDLVRLLRAAGQGASTDASSVSLILKAYHAFGPTFLDRLVGDFAFALWDADTRTLLCARDHFGVRPFFHARAGRTFLFASDMFAILDHPGISRTPDDEAVGDLLLFGGYQAREMTAFRDIRRLPAAHQAVVASSRVSFRQYWTPPLDTEIRYRRDSEYTEHFLELLTKAVQDRAHATHVAFQLTGGMDSTSIAAVVAGSVTPRPAWTSYTVTAERLVPGDEEGHYAGLVASHLDIPHLRIASEDYPLFARFDDPALQTADLASAPEVEMYYDDLVRAGKAGARVLFSGLGGDIVCTESGRFRRDGFRLGRLPRQFGDLWRHFRSTGSLRRAGLRAAFSRGVGGTAIEWMPDFPDWLSPDFITRSNLHERWAAGWRWAALNFDQRLFFEQPWVECVFESFERLRMPIVARYPFFDRRLMEFSLALPDYVKLGKKILRESMDGRLPAEILARPKTVPAGDSLKAKMSQGLIAFPPASELGLVSDTYVIPNQYVRAYNRYVNTGSKETWSSWQILAPVALNGWLKYTAQLPVSEGGIA